MAVDKRVKTIVSVTRVSQDSKIGAGKASATYAAQASCPTSCPLLAGDCYAEKRAIGFTTRQRNAVAVRENASATDIAHAEAAGIDNLPAKGALPLRVHVVGDCRTPEAAAIVGAAMVRYEQRTGQRAWTYTHAWADVPAGAWQGARVTASLNADTEADREAARAQGYRMVAVVGPAHHETVKATVDASGERRIPCPQQMGKAADCVSCKLCMAPEREVTIVFALH